MAKYFTADLHLNSTNIISYSSRPFKSAEDAAKKLIDTINKTCIEKTDILIHAGDFILTSTDRHGNVDDVPLDISLDSYLTDIKCRLFLLNGNHDTGCSDVEPDANNIHIDLNHMWTGVFVNHFPSNHKWYVGPKGTNYKTKINLCGHIHEKWFLYYDKTKNILNYNVGVDVHNYKPIKDSQITEHLDFIFKYCFSDDYDNLKYKCFWTVQDFFEFKKYVKENIKKDRIERKLEKYQKKGLTPEECERRKNEALKLKKLS